jgi:hypothetical protein
VKDMEELRVGLVCLLIPSAAQWLLANEAKRMKWLTFVLAAMLAGTYLIAPSDAPAVADNSKPGFDSGKAVPTVPGVANQKPEQGKQGAVSEQVEEEITEGPSLSHLPPAVAAEVMAIRSKGSRLSDGRVMHIALVKFVRVGNQTWAVGASGAEVVEPEVELPPPGVAIPEV